MGQLLHINPRLSFPVGEVFHVGDEYNGHQRGEFWFREDVYGRLRGPFHNEEEARHAMLLELATNNRA